jgi:hypothetical protein
MINEQFYTEIAELFKKHNATLWKEKSEWCDRRERYRTSWTHEFNGKSFITYRFLDWKDKEDVFVDEFKLLLEKYNVDVYSNQMVYDLTDEFTFYSNESKMGFFCGITHSINYDSLKFLIGRAKRYERI